MSSIQTPFPATHASSLLLKPSQTFLMLGASSLEQAALKLIFIRWKQRGLQTLMRNDAKDQCRRQSSWCRYRRASARTAGHQGSAQHFGVARDTMAPLKTSRGWPPCWVVGAWCCGATAAILDGVSVTTSNIFVSILLSSDSVLPSYSPSISIVILRAFTLYKVMSSGENELRIRQWQLLPWPVYGLDRPVQDGEGTWSANLIHHHPEDFPLVLSRGLELTGKGVNYALGVLQELQMASPLFHCGSITADLLLGDGVDLGH